MQKPKRGSNVPKVFLGGLPPNVTETDLRQFFDRYGKVVEVVIMYDQERRRTRGNELRSLYFCFNFFKAAEVSNVRIFNNLTDKDTSYVL